MEISIVINDPKTGKSYHKKAQLKPFIGLKIGDKVRGELIDLPGYEFQITGGSDDSGFPMRRDVEQRRKRILVSGKTVGFKRKLKKGERRRITVAGRYIHEKTAQINMKILKYGSKPLEESNAKEQKEENK